MVGWWPTALVVVVGCTGVVGVGGSGGVGDEDDEQEVLGGLVSSEEDEVFEEELVAVDLLRLEGETERFEDVEDVVDLADVGEAEVQLFNEELEEDVVEMLLCRDVERRCSDVARGGE